MKKKGLIISTIVMVVVLVASLTTATYAWFTTSSVTEITGFNLNVVASNVLNIGLKANNTYDAAATSDSFVSGNCTYSGTAGSLGGAWTGDIASLSASITHNINWGSVSSAVGVTTEDSAAAATVANTGTFKDKTLGTIIKANKATSGNSLSNAETALANGNGTLEDGVVGKQGDYAYLFLGVSPTTAIKDGTNKLYVVVQSKGAGTTVGIAAAVHVAYRINGTTAWEDKDAWDNTNGAAYSKPRAQSTGIIPGVDITSLTTTGLESVTSSGTGDNLQSIIPNSSVIAIDLTKIAVGEIDQLELIIYLCGSDIDCVDGAKGNGANIALIFGAQSNDAVQP